MLVEIEKSEEKTPGLENPSPELHTNVWAAMKKFYFIGRLTLAGNCILRTRNLMFT